MLQDLDRKVAEFIAGKNILITGAAGTVGTALTRRLLAFKPKVIRLLDHNEEDTFFLGITFGNNPNVRPLLGDIRDRERMKRAIQDVDVVFHAAALKHVSVGEYNPFEVVRTNLVALQDLIECCIDANVQKFIFTSSDKAVNPTNVMGGSKFIGERLVTAGNVYRGRARTVFVSTRFGNVLGSAGSVVPLFRRQIAEGGPVTVTDSSMTRFVMSELQAVDLILSALVAGWGGEVFVPKMQALRLQDLASGMIDLLAGGRPVKTVEIGLRPGEKAYEDLISAEEIPRCLETERLLIVLPFAEESLYEVGGRHASKLGPPDYPDNPAWVRQVYSSRTTTPLSKAGVLELLRTDVLRA
ncbi:MAG TPA: polysaccharide biosynthesis protein [Planctomycetota bacterium]|nr:polysaccharide biosynthesis protein [Planctomycetota bacterium]